MQIKVYKEVEMKRIVCLLTAILLVFVLTACGDDEGVPTGYKIASNSEACRYTLYVPEGWIASPGENKTDYTMSTVSNTDACNISLSVVTDVASGESFEAFWTAEEASYRTIFHEGFEVLEKGTVVKVGDASGFRCVFTARFGGKDYKYMQVFIPRSDFFTSELYAFTYTASADKVEGKDITHYDEHLETVNGILTLVKWK